MEPIFFARERTEKQNLEIPPYPPTPMTSKERERNRVKLEAEMYIESTP